MTDAFETPPDAAPTDAPAPAPRPGALAGVDLDAAGLRAYLLGSLHWRGAGHDDVGARLPRALTWYRQLAVRGGAKGLLLSWVYDVGHLLVEGDTFTFRSQSDLSAWTDEDRALRLEYENRLLNGLLRDPSARAAVESIKQDASRDDLVARAIELLLRPLLQVGGHEDAPAVDPVLLRELSPHGVIDPAAEAAAWEQRASAASGGPAGGSLRAYVRSSLGRFFGRRAPGPALLPDDLAEIEHWSAFKRSAQRLAARRIAARAADYPKVDPRQITVIEAQEAETETPDSGYYPTGGFSELANRGSLENLVPTELVYMGEDPFGDRPDPEVDLFALRFHEAETLFFARDSGQLKRTRRAVHVAIAPDDGLRLTLPWHGDPLAVLVYGLVVRLSEDLGRIFPADALTVDVHLISAGPSERVVDDVELLRVLLRHEIARGGASVEAVEPGFDLRALGERGRRVHGIAIAAGDRAPAGLPDGDPPQTEEGVRPPRLVTWRIGGAPVKDGAWPEVHMPVEGAPTGHLVAARHALLGAIAGLGGRGRVGARRR